MEEFFVGDRVRLKTTLRSTLLMGDLGTVVDILSQDNIGVSFDTFESGHNCREHCENGHGYYVPAGYIELDEKPKTYSGPASSEELFDLLGI